MLELCCAILNYIELECLISFAGPATASNNAFDLSKGKDDELLGNAFEKIGVPGNGPKEADDLRKKVCVSCLPAV